MRTNVRYHPDYDDVMTMARQVFASIPHDEVESIFLDIDRHAVHQQLDKIQHEVDVVVVDRNHVPKDAEARMRAEAQQLGVL